MFVISGSKYDKVDLKLEGIMNRSNEIVMTPPAQKIHVQNATVGPCSTDARRSPRDWWTRASALM